jgi:hypothetical protein
MTFCSLVKVDRRFGGMRLLHNQRRRVSQERNNFASRYVPSLACPYSLNVRICSSETTFYFAKTLRCYVPQNRDLKYSSVLWNCLCRPDVWMSGKMRNNSPPKSSHGIIITKQRLCAVLSPTDAVIWLFLKKPPECIRWETFQVNFNFHVNFLFWF